MLLILLLLPPPPPPLLLLPPPQLLLPVYRPLQQPLMPLQPLLPLQPLQTLPPPQPPLLLLPPLRLLPLLLPQLLPAPALSRQSPIQRVRFPGWWGEIIQCEFNCRMVFVTRPAAACPTMSAVSPHGNSTCPHLMDRLWPTSQGGVHLGQTPALWQLGRACLRLS
jgi:hypothetical protein